METSTAPPPLPPLLSADGLIGRISPTILLIVVIFGAIFAISGLLHLLIQYLVRKSNRERTYRDNATALEGQLQQLFHLHDSGVDQSFIDTLPIFLYKEISSRNASFDCAVCLCEFEQDDKLRLLPECGHAFHAECIDTWLLSHSTCPLCRTSLLPPFPSRCNYTPFVFLVESENENDSHENEEESASEAGQEPVHRTVPIKLGKLKSVAGEGSSKIDGRRCFSMGAFDYVTEEASLVRVRKVSPVESLSVSKIWLRTRKEKKAEECGSRRFFSFRLPVQIEGKAAVDVDVEAGRSDGVNVISREEETPSFARRTLMWISGRHHRTGNQSSGEVLRHDSCNS